MKKIFLVPGLAIALFLNLYSCSKITNSPKQGTLTLSLPSSTAQYYANNNNNINQRATLGRVLFYDASLSVNNAIACGSCHKQAAAFADNVAFSRGFQGMLTRRNSPAIQNLNVSGRVPTFFGNDTNFSSQSLLFWDGRENNVDHLIMRPISNHVEMGMENIASIPGKLSKIPYYNQLFTDAFGSSEITVGKISQAIAIFISSINTGNSRFEKFIKNNGSITVPNDGSFTDLEFKGLKLFALTYNCNSCHETTSGSSGYFSENFIDNGLNTSYTDPGFGALTRNPTDQGKFKAPRLHNVALSAPYMHDGRFKTLEEVLNYYSTGINNSPNLDPRLKDAKGQAMRFNIPETDKQALIAFLNSLTDYSMVTDPKFSNPFQIK